MVFTRDFISGEKNNIFNSVYGQSLIAAYLKYPEMKLIAGYFDRNEDTMFK